MDKPKPDPQVETKDQIEPEVKNSVKPIHIKSEVYWLVGVILVIALIFLAYKFGKQSVVPLQPLPTPSPVSQNSPTPSVDPTTNWKSYKNSKFGYEFKYPQDYFKFQEESDIGIYLAPSKGQGGNGPKFLNPGDVWLESEVDVSAKWFSIDDYLTSKLQKDKYSNAQKTLLINNSMSGYKITYDFPAVAGEVRIYNIEGLIIKNYQLYKITLSSWDQSALKQNENVFDQILSTFRFVDKGQESEAVNWESEMKGWKTYENKNMGISLKYPNITTPVEKIIPLKSGQPIFIASSIFNFDTKKISLCVTYRDVLCLIPGKNWGQDKNIQPTTVAGKNGHSFFLYYPTSDGGSTILHVIQIIEDPYIEIAMNVDGVGAEQTFQKILSTLKFTK